MKSSPPFLVFLAIVVSCSGVCAQMPEGAAAPGPPVRELNERIREVAGVLPATRDRMDYQIGPEDLIEISVFEVTELSRTVRVSAGGEISLPLIGAVKAAGLSPMELERVLTELLRRTYLKDPQVTVFLKEYKSDPVSVMGAVKMPDLYHIQTKRSLVEILAMAHGLSDGPMRHPGRMIVITRKPRPLATTGDPGGSATEPKAEIIEVPLKELLNSGDPKYNVPIYPGDVIKVVPAGTVYVAGAVSKPGAFPLTDFDNISAIQALAMAGGTVKAASQGKTVIIRQDPSGNRTEQRINLGRILKGKDPDVMLGANDILFVPGSMTKQSAIRAIEMAIQTTSGLIIWR